LRRFQSDFGLSVFKGSLDIGFSKGLWIRTIWFFFGQLDFWFTQGTIWFSGLLDFQVRLFVGIGFSIWILDFCSFLFCFTKIVYQLSFFNILKQKFAVFRSKLIRA
jgi:hypothetical protein